MADTTNPALQTKKKDLKVWRQTQSNINSKISDSNPKPFKLYYVATL
jgi:hypothetical protein